MKCIVAVFLVFRHPAELLYKGFVYSLRTCNIVGTVLYKLHINVCISILTRNGLDHSTKALQWGKYIIQQFKKGQKSKIAHE